MRRHGGAIPDRRADGLQPRLSPVAARGTQISVQLAALAAEWDVPTAHLAFADAFDHPHLATVLFRATSAEQVQSNVAALETYDSLDDATRAAIAALA
jgi:aryl-alcohol dehydrogenase-like predicted oxidoreductase